MATVVLLFLCVLKQFNKDEMELSKPQKIFKKTKLTKEERERQERLQTIWENVDNYNGDGLGQKEVK